MTRIGYGQLRQAAETARGDKPRLIIICNPTDAPAIQRGVVALGHTDILVRPNRYVECDQAYVMDARLLDGPLIDWPCPTITALDGDN